MHTVSLLDKMKWCLGLLQRWRPYREGVYKLEIWKDSHIPSLLLQRGEYLLFSLPRFYSSLLLFTRAVWLQVQRKYWHTHTACLRTRHRTKVPVHILFLSERGACPVSHLVAVFTILWISTICCHELFDQVCTRSCQYIRARILYIYFSIDISSRPRVCKL